LPLQPLNILFLGGAKRVSMAERFISAGKRLSLDVHLFSYELNDEVPIREIATIIQGGYWHDDKTLDHIKSAIRDNSINILIPFVDPATILASQIDSCFVAASSEDVSSLFFDKKLAQEWFIQNGFNVPAFNGTFPALAKPVYGSASNNIRVLYDQTETDAFFLRHSDKDYLLQKQLVGEEYSVDCYVEKDGSIIAIVPRIRLQVAGGEVTKTQTVEFPELVDLSEKIIRKSSLTGPVCIQFIKEAQTGEIYVIEVNPRFGGGVIASIEAGADMPFFLLNEYLGNKNQPVTDWQRGLLMMRAHREYFKTKN
jgi:carbamoyl-phosphate synthase large subunit